MTLIFENHHFLQGRPHGKPTIQLVGLRRENLDLGYPQKFVEVKSYNLKCGNVCLDKIRGRAANG